MPLDTLNLCFSTVFALLGIIGSTANLLVVLPNVRFLTKLAPSSFLVFCRDINFDVEACRFHAGVSVFGNISSILLCFGLTLFRYLIVVHQKDLPKNFATWYFLGVVFSATLVAIIPFIMGSQVQTYKMRPCNAHCAPDWSQRDVKSSILIWLCFSIATITLCFVVYAYAAMAGTIVTVFTGVKNVGGGTSKPDKRRKNRQQTDKIERISTVEKTSNSMLSDEGTSSHMSSQKNNQSRDVQRTLKLEKRQRDIMMQSIVVVGAFMIGWGPYICMAVYEYFSNSRSSPAVDFVVTGVVAIYELVNPLIIIHFDR
ncbi:hypothetical protein BJ741DRAFT_644510, partial [Chytriomyces cf. hyalinus JEL632]